MEELEEKYNNINIESINTSKIIKHLDQLVNYFFIEELTELGYAIEANDFENMAEELADVKITCEFMAFRYDVDIKEIEVLATLISNPKLELWYLGKVNIKLLRGILPTDAIKEMLTKTMAIYNYLLKHYNLNSEIVETWYNLKRKRIIYNYENNKLY